MDFDGTFRIANGANDAGDDGADFGSFGEGPFEDFLQVIDDAVFNFELALRGAEAKGGHLRLDDQDDSRELRLCARVTGYFLRQFGLAL